MTPRTVVLQCLAVALIGGAGVVLLELLMGFPPRTALAAGALFTTGGATVSAFAGRRAS